MNEKVKNARMAIRRMEAKMPWFLCRVADADPSVIIDNYYLIGGMTLQVNALEDRRMPPTTVIVCLFSGGIDEKERDDDWWVMNDDVGAVVGGC